MFKSFAIALFLAEASAINLGHHHHHHHRHPMRRAFVMDDPTCTTSQDTGHCLLTHYKDEGKIAHPIDYVVPNFGQDEDVKATLKFAQDAETDLDHKWVIPEGDPPAGPPMNYFVPNFGVDQDIKDSHENLAAVEKKMEHVFVLPKSKAIRENKAVPPLQAGPQELDSEVKSTLAHATAAEKSLDHEWKIVWN